jgi:hypothetical protein
MAVDPGFPAAGANCAHAVFVQIQQVLNNNMTVRIWRRTVRFLK